MHFANVRYRELIAYCYIISHNLQKHQFDFVAVFGENGFNYVTCNHVQEYSKRCLIQLAWPVLSS